MLPFDFLTLETHIEASKKKKRGKMIKIVKLGICFDVVLLFLNSTDIEHKRLPGQRSLSLIITPFKTDRIIFKTIAVPFLVLLL